MQTGNTRSATPPGGVPTRRQDDHVDFQSEVRQGFADQARQMQQMALDIQDIRGRLTPRADIEAMMTSRVSNEMYAARMADISVRIERLEKAPDASRANTRANLGLAIAAASILVAALCGGGELLVILIPHFH